MREGYSMDLLIEMRVGRCAWSSGPVRAAFGPCGGGSRLLRRGRDVGIGHYVFPLLVIELSHGSTRLPRVTAIRDADQHAVGSAGCQQNLRKSGAPGSSAVLQQ